MILKYPEMILATLAILTYPNPKLREKSTPIKDFDEKPHTFLDDMYDTMMGRKAVGVSKQILIINIPREEDNLQHKEDLLEIINPTFLVQEESIDWEEGCLSVPDFFENVKRFNKVSIAYKDRYGNDKILKAEGFLAVAIQHEIDHLNGILFVDKLPILRRKKFEQALKKCKNPKD